MYELNCICKFIYVYAKSSWVQRVHRLNGIKLLAVPAMLPRCLLCVFQELNTIFWNRWGLPSLQRRQTTVKSKYKQWIVNCGGGDHTYIPTTTSESNSTWTKWIGSFGGGYMWAGLRFKIKVIYSFMNERFEYEQIWHRCLLFVGITHRNITFLRYTAYTYELYYPPLHSSTRGVISTSLFSIHRLQL